MSALQQYNVKNNISFRDAERELCMYGKANATRVSVEYQWYDECDQKTKSVLTDRKFCRISYWLRIVIMNCHDGHVVWCVCMCDWQHRGLATD